ncbi:RHS repeat domain-containing protein [Serratia rhizosphaerae]|uniref:RHS repeat domain-containing protein n=1 Tax=Serratia rhizosphaerae TaxID=2597702 RepID=UPI002DB96EC5|nr:RHS repeat-associated core domain-containing protein [Serratia rhizosphaerae]MEB6336574.1 RHS domain-containing protein [Serratia rhizosphaerae]
MAAPSPCWPAARYRQLAALQAAPGSHLRRASSERSHPLVFERRYQWDRQDLVVQQKLIENDNLTDGPQFQQRRFGYDARGQLTHSILPQREERFYYDAAGNRSDGPATTVWRNLLQRLNGHRWGYDGFGRLSWRRDGNTGVEQRFQYDAEHRLTAVTFDGDSRYQRAEYRYDALGRRTRKTLYPHHGEPQTTLFHWNGLQMVGEHSPDQPQRSIQYLYKEDSYEPLARVDRHGDSSEVYWYHSELNGLPERMTDAQGKVVWHGRFSAWGATDAESGTLATAQNLRYQGQYLDRETGLHYNLFRYYDPNCGRFTQSDPIGLAGGVNTYAYTPDPISWVDPLGLVKCGIKGKYREIDKTDLPSWIKDSFKNVEYKTVVTTEEVTLYRVFGGNAKIDGSFVSTSPAANKIQVKIDSALLPEWKNTRQFEAMIKVPKGTILQIGKVEKQTMMSGAVLKGGADQILLPQNYPMSWISDVRFL